MHGCVDVCLWVCEWVCLCVAYVHVCMWMCLYAQYPPCCPCAYGCTVFIQCTTNKGSECVECRDVRLPYVYLVVMGGEARLLNTESVLTAVLKQQDLHICMQLSCSTLPLLVSQCGTESAARGGTYVVSHASSHRWSTFTIIVQLYSHCQRTVVQNGKWPNVMANGVMPQQMV